MWEVWDPRSQPLSGWKSLKTSTSIIWYIQQLVACSYLVLQSRLGFEGLTSHSTRTNRVSATPLDWLIEIHCLTFHRIWCWKKRKGWICIDVLALFSSAVGEQWPMPSENRTVHASDLGGEATAHPPFSMAAVLWIGLPSFCTMGPANFSRKSCAPTLNWGPADSEIPQAWEVCWCQAQFWHKVVCSLFRRALSTCLCIRFFKASTPVVLISLPRTDQRPWRHQRSTCHSRIWGAFQPGSARPSHSPETSLAPPMPNTWLHQSGLLSAMGPQEAFFGDVCWLKRNQ